MAISINTIVCLKEINLVEKILLAQDEEQKEIFKNHPKLKPWIIDRATVEIGRKSIRPYDLTFYGKYLTGEGSFASWLVLAYIRHCVPWTSSRWAKMTDHPQMAMEGDWSGVRDTEEENLWALFWAHFNEEEFLNSL